MGQPPPADTELTAPASGRVHLSRRQLVGAAGVSLAGFGPEPVEAAGGARQADRVTIVHDTHTHGRFGPADGRNIARYRTVVEQLLATHDNALFVGNGDDLAPSALGRAFEGEHIVDVLNDFPLAANGVGNHEFDFGVGTAIERFQESNFPWLAANLLTPDREPIPGTKRWTTVTAGGLTLGCFGGVVPTIHRLSQYPDDYVVLDPIEVAGEATTALREAGADVVVMLSHVRSDDHPDIAEAVGDLDVIVGSHSKRVFDAPKTVAGTVISEVGAEFDHVGVVTLDGAGGLAEWNRVDLTGEEDRHSGTWDVVEKWIERFNEQFGRPRFTSAGILDARRQTNAARETGLGNLVTDVMRTHLDGDVAALDAGAFRTDAIYGPGPIQGLAVREMLRGRHPVVRVALSGEQLRRFLGQQVATLPESDQGAQSRLQVSGLQYEWSGHGNAAVRNVYVGGDPLDAKATYRLVITDRLATNRESLADAERQQETDGPLWRLVLEALAARRHVEPTVNHRVLRVDETVGTAALSSDDDGVTARVDRPDPAASVYRSSFYALTQWGHAVAPHDVSVSDDQIEATFDADALGVITTGADAMDVRLFGGFDPDDAQYGYEDGEGNRRDLPVADWPYYVLKADIDADAEPLQG